MVVNSALFKSSLDHLFPGTSDLDLLFRGNSEFRDGGLFEWNIFHVSEYFIHGGDSLIEEVHKSSDDLLLDEVAGSLMATAGNFYKKLEEFCVVTSVFFGLEDA